MILPIIILFSCFSLILIYIGYNVKEASLLVSGGSVLMLLGLLVVVGGIDIESGITRTENITSANVTEITEDINYSNSDNVFINGGGLIAMIIGFYVMYVGYSNGGGKSSKKG